VITPLVLVAVLSTVVAFLLVAAEASLGRISPSRTDELADEERPGSGSLVRVIADLPPYLAVLTFVRSLAYAAIAVPVGLVAHELTTSPVVGVLSAIAVMALLSFVIVEVSPRALGRAYYVRVALVAAPIAVGLRTVLGPVARLLIAVANALTPGPGERDGPFDSEAELRDLVDLATDSRLIEDDERDMIHSVFELSDTVAREVMVPRIDMESIQEGKTLRQAMSLFLRSGYSRVPVVGEDSDDIRGLLYLKDVVLRTHADPDAATQPVTQVMRPATFVPESKKVDDLLREMQRDQYHFAIVVDEYGGTAGLVTIEDILEEIVGEISDEYDREAPGVETLEAGMVRVPASMDIDDLADLFDIEIDEEEVDTVGGLLTKCIGRMPTPGSTAEVAGLRLTAERMAGRRHRLATVIVQTVCDPVVEAASSATSGRRDD
jgi:CBS domain containing-hemolysin-like protein